MTDATMNLFVSKDPTKTTLNTPWTWNGYTGASDGHIMLLVPGEDRRYKPIEINIAAMFPPRVKGKSIAVEHLRETLDMLPLIPEMVDETVKCEECDGTGIVECSKCSQDTDCEECDGKGTLETNTKPTGKMIPKERAVCGIDGVLFQQGLLRRLLAVADEVGSKLVKRVTDPTAIRANEFTVNDDIRVIIMPIREKPDIELGVANAMTSTHGV